MLQLAEHVLAGAVLRLDFRYHSAGQTCGRMQIHWECVDCKSRAPSRRIEPVKIRHILNDKNPVVSTVLIGLGVFARPPDASRINSDHTHLSIQEEVDQLP